MVVLEFWATWCAPCVEVIPHLNELAKKFESRGLQFISFTDKDAPVIEKFLRDHPIEGWVGLDTDRPMFNGYGVEGVPHTVLVGADGGLLAATNPQAVTEHILEEILAGKVDEMRAKLPKPLTPTDRLAGLRSPDAPGPLYELLIRPHQDSGVVGIKGCQSQYIARGFTVKDAIQNAYDVSLARAVIPEALGRDAYDILISIPRADSDSLRRALQQALETTFGLRLHREFREADVVALVAPEGPPPALREVAGSRRGSVSNRER